MKVRLRTGNFVLVPIGPRLTESKDFAEILTLVPIGKNKGIKIEGFEEGFMWTTVIFRCPFNNAKCKVTSVAERYVFYSNIHGPARTRRIPTKQVNWRI